MSTAPETSTPAAAAAAPAGTTLPETMKRLVLKEPGSTIKDCKIEVETDAPLPKLQPNEVLVKVAAAAINPSDYGTWKAFKPENCPLAMGLEGCGTVVALGGSFTTKRFKIGAKVGICGPKNKQGTYSEYVAMNAVEGVYPLPETMEVADAASFFVNPFTAIGILETAKHCGSKALVHTAAASQVGQMLVKLAKQEGMEIINIVRREEQAKLLTDLGATHVVTTSEENWKETLKSKIDQLHCTVAFDAVAGDGAGDLLRALPDKGTLFIYGGLAGAAGTIDPVELVYKQKEIKGFFLTNWLTANNNMLLAVPRILMTLKKVNAGLTGGWSSTQFQDTTMEKAQEDLVELLAGSVTGKKLRIRFDVV